MGQWPTLSLEIQRDVSIVFETYFNTYFEIGVESNQSQRSLHSSGLRQETQGQTPTPTQLKVSMTKNAKVHVFHIEKK